MENIALISGAAGGLGSALARRLSEQGWSLALVSRERGRLAGLSRLPRTCTIEADLSQPDGARQAMEKTREHFGKAPDALAHCAGTTLIAPLHRTRTEQYRDCMRANVDSAFFTLSAFVNACLDAGQPGSAGPAGRAARRSRADLCGHGFRHAQQLSQCHRGTCAPFRFHRGTSGTCRS